MFTLFGSSMCTQLMIGVLKKSLNSHVVFYPQKESLIDLKTDFIFFFKKKKETDNHINGLI